MTASFRAWTFFALIAALVALAPARGRAASAAEIDARAELALTQLLRTSPTARAVADRALAVMVFPGIVKGGFGFGGQYGEGVLRVGGLPTGYYRLASASFGLQAGAQSYSQVIFFMDAGALAYLDKSGGFEIGADANVTVVDTGIAADVSSTTLQDPIAVFVFGQQGLMAGISVEGSKITPFTPK